MSGDRTTGDPRLTEAGWRHLYSGKVRDLYESDAHPGRLLVIASDRVSAFDTVLDPPIPGKGALLTRLSLWWFGRLGEPHHLAASHPSLGEHLPTDLADRAMLVHRLEMHPVECVARGYLAGSGWAEYRETGAVCGIRLPAGLTEGDRLPEPIFTPAFKAPAGHHDENITFDRTVEIVGAGTAERLRDATMRIYRTAAAIAEERGLILADTKFEFGAEPGSDEIVIADEVLTSDSSRYWDAETHAAGGKGRLDSFDKQHVRNWMSANWDRRGTPPALPASVVELTLERYRELVRRITGDAVPGFS